MLDAMRREVEDSDDVANTAYAPLRAELQAFAVHGTLAAVAGLLTVPKYQTATHRIELFLHLVASACRGKRRPKDADLRRWVNGMLGALPVARAEDPCEDVFVSNVTAGGRNFRIFEGTWELNDYYLQHILDCIGETEWARPYFRLRHRVYALLRIGDLVAQRAGVDRWETTSERYPRTAVVEATPEIATLAQRVTFTESDLTAGGIEFKDLEPFLATNGDLRGLADSRIRNSALIRRPLAVFGKEIVVARPTAISTAVRLYVLDWATENRCLDDIQRLLDSHQAEIALKEAVKHVEYPTGMLPPPEPTLGEHALPPHVIGDAIVPFDTDKCAHIVLLRDDLRIVRDDGFISTEAPNQAAADALANFLKKIASQIAVVAPGGGLTIVVSGGLGRGGSLSLPVAIGPWHVVAFSLGDFELFATSDSASFLRLWKLQRAWDVVTEGGIRIANLSGELNLYEFWSRRDFLLAPPEVPFPRQNVGVSIPTDSIYEFRVRERRRNDVHSASFGPTGNGISVRRLQRGSYFASVRTSPVYASEDFARSGELAGVVETPNANVWVHLSRVGDKPDLLNFAHEIWEAVLEWLARLLPTIEASTRWKATTPPFAIHVRLRLDDQPAWEALSRAEYTNTPERPAAVVHPDTRSIGVRLPIGFAALLQRPSNDGERALLEELVVGIFAIGRSLSGTTADDEKVRAEAERLVALCLDGPDARALHMFSAPSFADLVAPSHTEHPRLIQGEDSAAWALALAWRAMTADELAALRKPDDAEFFDITGKGACGKLLHDIVHALWVAIRDELVGIDVSSVVEMATTNTEAVSRDRIHWRRTSRAMHALYSKLEDVQQIAAQREVVRAKAALSSRILIEMAICTAQPSGSGKQISYEVFDRLAAAIALLIELAFDADAIYGGFGEPSIRVYANGAIAPDEAFLRDVVATYGRETHGRGFRDAVDSYDDLFIERSAAPKTSGDSLLDDAAFGSAFKAEHGITVNRFIDGFRELLDLAYAHHRSCVATTRAIIVERLRSNQHFTEAEVSGFLSMLTLEPRPRWDVAPEGFDKRDWRPWRFRRSLSVVTRPIVALGPTREDPCYFGVNQLNASISYLFEGMRAAWFPEGFFKSDAMRAYRGQRTNELGHEFAEDVSRDLEAAGYKIHLEVPMQRIGAPAELGDIDVVAWRADGDVVWLLECKRLTPDKTVGEIVERLNQFRGESNDSLARHLARVSWVVENAPAVVSALGIDGGARTFVPILVTNATVPMQFVTGLPLATERIVAREELLRRLGEST